MFTVSNNKRIKMILCIAIAATMVFGTSGCVAVTDVPIGVTDRSHMSATTPDEDSPDKNIPDGPAENYQTNTVTGELEIGDVDAPELGNHPLLAPSADIPIVSSPNPAPQSPENTAENAPSTGPADEDLVRVLDYISSIYVELKYATEDNFTGMVIYDFTDAYLRYGTVKKLAGVQAELQEQGYSLKIWDAYRPVSAQFKLWEICPDPVYVANPNTGYSSHSRGNTVDVTLVLADGTEIEMPTGFDDFSTLADRDYSDVSADATENVLILENVMKDYGFNCYSGEWWHYSDSSTYPVVQN